MPTKDKELNISVIIATYNRAEILRQTLESITRLDRDGLSVEFVVVDNNSTDNTKEVVEFFAGKFPIRYLFEARPGKNCALNRALNEVPLGKLVVFTDDDVEPNKDWFRDIMSASHRWPQYSVFGGRQFLIYPDGNIPKWARNPKIMPLVFGWHDHGDEERPYVQGGFPFGANFWVRREVFAGGIRFNENIGPRPKGRIMGSEIAFLKHLAEEGYGMVYCPGAVVGHRIMPEQMSITYPLARAYRYGRWIAHKKPLCRAALFDKHPIIWNIVRIGAIVKLSFWLVVALVPLAFQKPRRAVKAMTWIGYNVELLKIAGEKGDKVLRQQSA